MHAGNLKPHWYDANARHCLLDEFTERAGDIGYTTSGYYFWDETEAYVVGPYETAEKAEVARSEYIKQLG